MMSRFLYRPKILYSPQENPKRPWLLMSDCAYLTDVPEGGDTVVISAGYRTDLASVPRVPGIYWRVGNRAILPAIVHDYLYEHDPHDWGRKVADRIFWEAMADEKDPPWPTTRWAMYMGVRLGGWRAWQRYRRAERAASGG